MRPISPIRLVETLDGGTQVASVAPCELHPTTPQGTLLVQLDSNYPSTMNEVDAIVDELP